MVKGTEGERAKGKKTRSREQMVIGKRAEKQGFGQASPFAVGV